MKIASKIIPFFIGFMLFTCTGAKDQATKNESENELQNEVILPKDAIPITYFRHLYIHGMLNGQEANLIFDTAGINILLDSAYYADNNFSQKEGFDIYLSGGGEKVQRAGFIKDTTRFAFDKFLYETTFVPIFNLRKIVSDYADGIMGPEFFADKVLKINYRDRYIQIYPHIDSLEHSNYSKIPIERNGGKYFLPAAVFFKDELKADGRFLLDIGSGGNIILTSSAAHKYNLDRYFEKKRLYRTKVGGIGGQSESCFINIDSIVIAEFVLKKLEIEYSKDKSGAFASANYDGVMGNKIFERFDVIIDFRDKELYLQPNANFENPFIPSNLGFTFTNRQKTFNGWIVSGLFENEPAKKAGLEIGDTIVSVNGVSVMEKTLASQHNYIEGLNNSEIELGIKSNNSIRTVTFDIR